MINLSGNKLIGKLPIEILSLLELATLNVSGNNLTGEIPHLIGQLKRLETFDLSRNQFSGEIPLSMSELSFLKHLDLSYNHLFGKIPSSTCEARTRHQRCRTCVRRGGTPLPARPTASCHVAFFFKADSRRLTPTRLRLGA